MFEDIEALLEALENLKSLKNPDALVEFLDPAPWNHGKQDPFDLEACEKALETL